MTYRLVLLIFALVGIVPSVASAQGSCQPIVPRSVIIERLAGRYNEQPIGVGIRSDGTAIELFVSADSRTWTIVATMPAGLSCVLAAGEDWETVETLMGDLL